LFNTTKSFSKNLNESNSSSSANPTVRSNYFSTYLQSTTAAQDFKQTFATLQPALAADINPVAAGGWYNIEKHCANPKEDLVELIIDGLKRDSKKVEFEADAEKVEALAAVLYAHGKGFDSDLVEGDWKLVFSKQGKNSPKFQKAVGKKEMAGKTDNSFDTKAMTFSGEATILKKGKIGSTVKVKTRPFIFFVI